MLAMTFAVWFSFPDTRVTFFLRITAFIDEGQNEGMIDPFYDIVGSYRNPQASTVLSSLPNITVLLNLSSKGDERASEELLRAVYDELKRRAHGQRMRWHGNLTMNTTALVHEAYLKLLGKEAEEFRNRGHFMATASRAMRQILVDYARRVDAQKRGGDAVMVSLDDELNIALPQSMATEVLDLHSALDKLEIKYPDLARVVECRVFAGMMVEETAEALSIGTATVKRRWAMAQSWLKRALKDETEGQV